MRLYLICIVCLLYLSGCVNYAGLHKNSIPLNDAMLSTSSPEPHPTTFSENWWHVFNDPALNKLIETALADSPTLQIAQSRIEEATHLADAANSTLWPSVNAHGQLNRERITANTIFPPPFGGNTYTESYLGLNFNYEFDFWGKNRQTLAAKISAQRAAEADYAEARLVLAAAVANQYFQLQYNLAARKIAADIQQQRQSIFQIVQARLRHGVESAIPLNTAHTNKESANITVTGLNEQIQLAQHQLAVLMGKNPLTTEIETQPFNYDKKTLTLPKVLQANLLGRRPDIIASRWRLEIAAHKVNAAKARFYPNINLLGFLSLQSYTLSQTFTSPSRDNLIGAAIDLPIFDAGARRANLSMKYDEFDMASAQYNQIILTALQDAANQLTTLQALDQQEAEQQIALKAAQKRYRLTLARYQHGISDYLGVLDTQGSFLQEKNKQIQLQAQHLKAMVAMIKAVGGNYSSG